LRTHIRKSIVPLLLNSAEWAPGADGKICCKRQGLELRPKPAQNNRLDRTELSIPIIAVRVSESFMAHHFTTGGKQWELSIVTAE